MIVVRNSPPPGTISHFEVFFGCLSVCAVGVCFVILIMDLFGL